MCFFDDAALPIPSRELTDVLNAARTRVERAYESRHNRELCVIHCDLWHDNLKLYHGKLAPVDFEDAILGYPRHDIAMALLDLAESVDAETYKSYLDSFVRG